jgi:hypothetical protein
MDINAAAFEDIVRQDEAIIQRRRKRKSEKLKGKYTPTKLGIIATDSSDSTTTTAAVSPSVSVDWFVPSTCDDEWFTQTYSFPSIFQADLQGPLL